MGKFTFKCITKDAELACTLCSGQRTTFMLPVPNQNITKEQNREIAVKEDITINPFPAPCNIPGISPPPPCTPVLTINPVGGWRVIDQSFLVDNKMLLVEKSLNRCVKTGIISIVNKKQDIISVDLAGMIIKAIKALECMIDFRLNQFTNDKPAFDSAFAHYFGNGHTETDKQIIIDRMNKVKNLTGQMIDPNGTLNENHFEPDMDTSKYSTYAYVYSSRDSNQIQHLPHVVHICPNFFSDSTNISGMDSKAGTIGHESSHFRDIGGTTDRDSSGNLVYGQSNARQLAISDPAQALIHADSFEYFLESGAPCT
jgi:hypothetical protein